MNNNLNSNNNPKDDNDRHVKIIHTLAKRLPWITVFFVALAALITILEVYFRKN